MHSRSSEQSDKNSDLGGDMLNKQKPRPIGFHALAFDLTGIPRMPMLLPDGHVCAIEFLTTQETDTEKPVVITIKISGNNTPTTEYKLTEGQAWCVTNSSRKILMMSFHG